MVARTNALSEGRPFRRHTDPAASVGRQCPVDVANNEAGEITIGGLFEEMERIRQRVESLEKQLHSDQSSAT